MGQRYCFQITIPPDAKRIIGIEYGATQKDGDVIAALPEPGAGDSLIIFQNRIIGRLVLRSAGCSGVFFQSDLVEDRNIHFGEITAPLIWQPQPWSHGSNRYETQLSVQENTIVHGIFTDSWGIGEYEWLNYKLNLYLWIEKCIT